MTGRENKGTIKMKIIVNKLRKVETKWPGLWWHL
jgi:hypothetical protein